MVKVVYIVAIESVKPISAAVNKILILRIALAITSRNVSSGRYIAYAMADSEREEQSGATIFFEDVSGRTDTFHEISLTYETRG